MRDFIKECIDEYYIKNNKKLWRQLCEQKYDLSSFIDELKEHYVNCEIINHVDEPCIHITFYEKSFVSKELKIEYYTELRICKVCKIFNLDFLYEVKNPDPQGMGCLYNSLEESWNCNQYDLGEKIISFLNKEGYERLFFKDLIEVVPQLEMPENGLFGNQMTIENALFHDFYELYEN